MTNNIKIYKCSVCGNVVELLNDLGGTLSCCDTSMTLLDAKMVDGAREKHLPKVDIEDDKAFVTVGEVEHPMEQKHYITFIEVITPSNRIIRQNLRPNDKPSMEFCLKEKGVYKVREYCNLHGLWEVEVEN